MTAIAEAPVATKRAGEIFSAKNGVTVRRVSDNTVAVSNFGWGEIVYILPVPEYRSRVDSPEAWRKRAEDMGEGSSKDRHDAVIEFMSVMEPANA